MTKMAMEMTIIKIIQSRIKLELHLSADMLTPCHHSIGLKERKEVIKIKMSFKPQKEPV